MLSGPDDGCPSGTLDSSDCGTIVSRQGATVTTANAAERTAKKTIESWTWGPPTGEI